MVIETNVTFPDESRWFLCAGWHWNGEGDIVIPVGQFEHLSNEEIGSRVNQLRHPARILAAERLVRYLRDNGIHRASLNHLIDCLSRLKEFMEDSDAVKCAIKEIEKRIDYLQRRQKARKTKPKKRKYVQSNYDKLFVKVGRRDSFACAQCGSSTKELQIDHIIPLAENGSNALENLQLLCPSCNRQKSDNLNWNSQ